MGIWQNIYTNHPTVISTSLAAIVAFAVAVISIRKQRQISKEKNSLDFEASYKNNKDIRDAWNTLRVIKKQGPEYLVELVRERENSHRPPLLLILNEWERSANAIFHDLYDENLLYKAYGTSIIDLFLNFSPFIRECQLINPRIFINITKLAVRWQIRRAIEDNHNHSKELASSLKELHTASKNFSVIINNTYDENKNPITNLKARGSDFNRVFKKIK